MSYSSVFPLSVFSVEGELPLGAWGMLQLGNLFGLVALPLAALLILAYRRQQPGRKLMVGSLFILRELAQRPLARRRLKLPLRFFLELLCLFALAAALALPMLDKRSPHVAIVLDNSLGMSANSGAETRIELGKRRIRDEIAASADSRFTVFTSAPKLARVSSPESTAGVALSALDGIQPASADDALDVQLSELLHGRDFERIIVVSDRALSSDSRSAVARDLERTSLDWIQVGAPVSNAALIDARMEDTREEPGGSLTLVVRIQLSSNTAADAEISVVPVSPFKRSEQTLPPPLRQKIRLAAAQRHETRIGLPSAWGEFPAFKIELAPEQGFVDAIAEDNRAWVSLKPYRDAQLLLVTPLAKDASALGLKALTSFQTLQIGPDQYPLLTPADIRRFSAIIFHRTSPANLPPVPSLFVTPPSPNALVDVTEERQSPPITSWLPDHPITTYLKVPLLSPAQSLTLGVPAWAQSVLNTDHGSMIVAGETLGVRYVATGFELLPYEGKRTPVVTVLTLNILSWLRGDTQFGAEQKSGMSLPLAAGSTWVVAAPSGKVTTIDAEGDKPSYFPLPAPGLYQLTGVRTDREGRIERTERLLAVNAFFPSESETFVMPALQLSTQLTADDTADKPISPLWPMLLVAALVLLTAELTIGAFARGRV